MIPTACRDVRLFKQPVNQKRDSKRKPNRKIRNTQVQSMCLLPDSLTQPTDFFSPPPKRQGLISLSTCVAPTPYRCSISNVAYGARKQKSTTTACRPQRNACPLLFTEVAHPLCKTEGINHFKNVDPYIPLKNQHFPQKDFVQQPQEGQNSRSRCHLGVILKTVSSYSADTAIAYSESPARNAKYTAPSAEDESDHH